MKSAMLSFERWNDLSARARGLSQEERADLLEEDGVSADDFRAAESAHMSAIVAGLAVDDLTLADARVERLRLESDRLATATRPSAPPKPPIDEPVASELAAPAVVAPSYLLGGHGADSGGPSARRPEPEPATAFEADETLPIPSPFAAAPAVPFSGTKSTAEVLAQFGPAEAKRGPVEPGPDETALLPQMTLAPRKTGSFTDALGPVAVPLLSLDEYAELRAHLSVFGEDHRPTLARFGVEAREVREALRGRFADFFQRDPRAQAQFLERMERIARALQLDRETKP